MSPYVFTDKAGNDERMAFLYRWRKLELLEKIGELAIPPSDYRYIKLPGTTQKFRGFDRNPFLVTFETGASLLRVRGGLDGTATPSRGEHYAA